MWQCAPRQQDAPPLVSIGGPCVLDVSQMGQQKPTRGRDRRAVEGARPYRRGGSAKVGRERPSLYGASLGEATRRARRVERERTGRGVDRDATRAGPLDDGFHLRLRAVERPHVERLDPAGAVSARRSDLDVPTARATPGTGILPLWLAGSASFAGGSTGAQVWSATVRSRRRKVDRRVPQRPSVADIRRSQAISRLETVVAVRPGRSGSGRSSSAAFERP